MGTVLLCLALNIAAFFYLHAWRPVVDLVKWVRLSRSIKAMRVAGLLLLLLLVNVAPIHAQTVTPMPRSDGDDALVAKWVATPDGITGVPTIDNALLYVWNNCGKLMLVFVLLAAVSILRSKLALEQPTYGDYLRREAAARWEAETDDDSIHNPFNSPEGMQPASQYVSVRTR